MTPKAQDIRPAHSVLGQFRFCQRTKSLSETPRVHFHRPYRPHRY